MPPAPPPGPRLGLARSFALAMLVLLAGCGPSQNLTPPLRVLPPPTLQPADTPASAAERAYFAATQASLLNTGLLRTDGGGSDASFDADRVAETFLSLAFYDEYGMRDGRLEQREAAAPLTRWSGPVRVSVEFGPSVPPDRQATERARIGSYLARLSLLTGHPIGLSGANTNFVVYIGSIDERRGLAPRLVEALPGLDEALITEATRLGRANFCLVYVNTDPRSFARERAMAVIPSELPDLMRLMCLHEELAQGLGLGNDSRQARPSIFNDDNEFATLTGMDEVMLQMLYSPELRPGMTEAEARPIVYSLASRLVGGES